MKTNIKLCCENGKNLQFEANYITVEHKVIALNSLDIDYSHLFLAVSHNSINTLLDFTGIKDYKVLYFDADGNFKGQSFAINNECGFMLQTQMKKILLLKNSIEILETSNVCKYTFLDEPKY